MVLPRDREEEYRSRLMSLVQDQVRKVMETFRTVLTMVENVMNDASLKDMEVLYNEILKHDEAEKEIKRTIEREIANLGALLSAREDILRLVNCLDKIVDFSEGIAYRLLGLVKIKVKVNKDIMKNILHLGEMVYSILGKMREALLAVTLNVETFMKKAEEVESIERNIDEIYRELNFLILQSDMKVGHMLLVREIVSILEDISDKAEESVDILRYFSFIPV